MLTVAMSWSLVLDFNPNEHDISGIPEGDTFHAWKKSQNHG